jgi:hypothetical protein
MSNKIKKYIDAAKNGNQSFANADGEFDVLPSTNTNVFANANGMYRNAAGNGMVGSAPTSQPYSINITNASAAAVADVVVLGSYTYLNNPPNGTWSNGSLTIGSVTISSATPGVTYQQLLAQLQNKPILVGTMVSQSSTAAQILKVLNVKTKDANGNEQTMPIVPILSPNQFQSTVIQLDNVFTIDGFTEIKIAELLASTTQTLNIYPADKIDPTKGLVTSSISSQYGNPGITKAQPVVLQG